MNIKKYKVIILPNFKHELYKIFGDTLEYSKSNMILTLITKKLKHLEDMPYMYAIISHIFYKKSNYHNKL